MTSRSFLTGHVSMTLVVVCMSHMDATFFCSLGGYMLTSVSFTNPRSAGTSGGTSMWLLCGDRHAQTLCPLSSCGCSEGRSKSGPGRLWNMSKPECCLTLMFGVDKGREDGTEGWGEETVVECRKS